MKPFKIIFLAVITLILAGAGLWLSGYGVAGSPICGNRIVEGYEECDNGELNSDSQPNACRTDCVLPRCGDGVIDSGEECDDGGYPRNHDLIPDACRSNCKKAHCGDGVLDSGEECDDKNSDPYDGCHQCQSCYLPKDDLILSTHEAKLKLCPGGYEFKDSGEEGIIILTGYSMILDCNNAVIVSKPVDIKGKPQTKIPQAVIQPGSDKSKSEKPESTQPPKNPPNLPVAELRQGTGIVIKGQEVVLHNCQVEKFRTGVKLKSTGAILFNNRICGNSKDIVSENPGNFGVKNYCSLQDNWQENGSPGCTRACGQ